MNPWIQTYTGKRVNPLDLRPEDIDIVDIAHSLSLLCRFTGHTKVFYSVAQHSIEVSKLVHLRDALAGLMHDAAEAYFADLNRPVKGCYPDYERDEVHCCARVFDRFGIMLTSPYELERADRIVGLSEARDLINEDTSDWPAIWGNGYDITAADLSPKFLARPVKPEVVQRQFLRRFDKLTGGRYGPLSI